MAGTALATPIRRRLATLARDRRTLHRFTTAERHYRHARRVGGRRTRPPDRRRTRYQPKWFVRACHKRWGAEDATRGIEQQFRAEQFLARTRRALRRLLWPVAWSFGWLNVWGAESYAPLRDALMNHPWRLEKAVTDLFDWIATMLRRLLHPHPKLTTNTG